MNESALRNVIASIRNEGTKVSCLAVSPKPILVCESMGESLDEVAKVADYAEVLGSVLVELMLDIPARIKQQPDREPLLFRCVEFSRMQQVVRTGCDVEPTDATLYAAGPGGKAAEYGGKERVMLVFDGWLVERCVHIVERSAADLHRLRKLYPFERAGKGATVTLSKVPFNTLQNEIYSMYIPGEPWESLLAVLIVGPIAANLSEKCLALLQQSGRPWKQPGYLAGQRQVWWFDFSRAAFLAVRF